MPRFLRSAFNLCMFAGMLLIGSARPGSTQVMYDVLINTIGLNGTNGQLAFDLTNGDNATANNTIKITNFTSDATLTGGTNTNTLGASGNLPGTVTLVDQQFFNESRRPITFGNSIGFTITATTNFAAPGGPDGFAFFLTDAANTGSVVSTSDPSGADALFSIDITGSQSNTSTVYTTSTLGVSYSVSFSVAPTEVPEPAPLASVAVGLMAGTWMLRVRRMRRPA